MSELRKYRVFVQDVGTDGYSGFCDVLVAKLLPAQAAVLEAGNGSLTWAGRKLIALPFDRRDLWPNNQTGEVPPEALKWC